MSAETDDWADFGSANDTGADGDSWAAFESAPAEPFGNQSIDQEFPTTTDFPSHTPEVDTEFDAKPHIADFPSSSVRFWILGLEASFTLNKHTV